MAFTIFNPNSSCAMVACWSLKKSLRAKNGLVITMTFVLLLMASFVQDCRGKSFHSMAGQAEVEEDTSQGSLKEKFPMFSLLHTDGNGDEGDDYSQMANVDLGIGRAGESLPMSHLTGNLNKDEEQRQHHLLRHLSPPSNYGIVHKRSRDDGEEDDLRGKERQGFAPSSNPRPVYEQSSVDGSNPNFRVRQKLMSLRNQFGDKWFAFVSPYAYRKRQILYRQCFFNPISCF